MSPHNLEVDLGYLREVEQLAHNVVEVAAEQGWLTFGDQSQEFKDPFGSQ